MYWLWVCSHRAKEEERSGNFCGCLPRGKLSWQSHSVFGKVHMPFLQGCSPFLFRTMPNTVYLSLLSKIWSGLKKKWQETMRYLQSINENKLTYIQIWVGMLWRRQSFIIHVGQEQNENWWLLVKKKVKSSNQTLFWMCFVRSFQQQGNYMLHCLTKRWLLLLRFDTGQLVVQRRIVKVFTYTLPSVKLGKYLHRSTAPSKTFILVEGQKIW